MNYLKENWHSRKKIKSKSVYLFDPVGCHRQTDIGNKLPTSSFFGYVYKQSITVINSEFLSTYLIIYYLFIYFKYLLTYLTVNLA